MFDQIVKQFYNESQLTFIKRTTRIGAMMGKPSYATKQEIRDVLGIINNEIQQTIDDYVDRIYAQLIWEKKYVL